jgi:hypothetical protein
MYTLNMLLDILLRIVLFSTDVTCEFFLLSLRNKIKATKEEKLLL